MAKTDPESPLLFVDRELSWLEFNQRVLAQAQAHDVPLMERLKFLAIVASNLDEFFMIRVAGLKQQVEAGVTACEPGGLTPAEQLDRIGERAHRMAAEHAATVAAALGGLREHDLHVVDLADLSPAQREALDAHFVSEVLPALTPLAVDDLAPMPVIPGLGLNLAVLLDRPRRLPDRPPIAVVPIPRNLPRFLSVRADRGSWLVPLEQVVGRGLRHLFPHAIIEAVTVFRLTRDADIAVHEDEAEDLLAAIEEAVRSRRRRAVVRLELSAQPDPRLSGWLREWCEVGPQDVYETAGLLDATALTELVGRPGFSALRDPEWRPQPPQDLIGADILWEWLQKRDVLLVHPYESFDPVVELLDAAAADPSVLAIKQTLYRTSGDSPIVGALARAAESGKQVTVLVELKARFDEARNASWARRLEDAGCHVIYGVAGLKTHAKLLLIVRREPHGIRRYVHASTGNYNDRTARLYSDIGLMTSDREFAADASAFFNLLTGYSHDVGWLRLVISPTSLRHRVLELIEREAAASTPDQPGLIMVKVNSLQDPAVIRALCRASGAGVRVRLNVRGVCCLRPGVPGASENIEIISIVDRFLEHARVLYFRNGGHEEVYLSSADMMERNLDRRLEILFPVVDPRLRQRLTDILETYFADNTMAWRLTSDGTQERVQPQGREPVRAQARLYEMARNAAEAAQPRGPELHPLTRPAEPGG